MGKRVRVRSEGCGMGNEGAEFCHVSGALKTGGLSPPPFYGMRAMAMGGSERAG